MSISITTSVKRLANRKKPKSRGIRMKSQNSPTDHSKSIALDKEAGYDPRNSSANTKPTFPNCESRLYRPTGAEKRDFDLLREVLSQNQSMYQFAQSIYLLRDFPATQPDMS